MFFLILAIVVCVGSIILSCMSGPIVVAGIVHFPLYYSTLGVVLGSIILIIGVCISSKLEPKFSRCEIVENEKLLKLNIWDKPYYLLDNGSSYYIFFKTVSGGVKRFEIKQKANVDIIEYDVDSNELPVFNVYHNVYKATFWRLASREFARYEIKVPSGTILKYTID